MQAAMRNREDKMYIDSGFHVAWPFSVYLFLGLSNVCPVCPYRRLGRHESEKLLQRPHCSLLFVFYRSCCRCVNRVFFAISCSFDITLRLTLFYAVTIGRLSAEYN